MLEINVPWVAVVSKNISHVLLKALKFAVRHDSRAIHSSAHSNRRFAIVVSKDWQLRSTHRNSFSAIDLKWIERMSPPLH